MKQININKAVLLNGPYVLVGLFATKISEAYRLSAGTDFTAKIMNIMDAFSSTFQSYAPSFYPYDLIFGIICGAALRLAVYIKGKNAKIYRKNVEYGSARWGSAKDIEPFVDPKPKNNVILTKTESLTMNSRPKNPKYARNKNVLIVGGSGSG